MIKRFLRWLDSWQYYIIMDGRDNSISFSRGLFRHIKINSDTPGAKVLVTRDPDGIYVFNINPKGIDEKVLSQIQFNERYHSIGFESLCPTVNKILYDYNLKASIKCRLSVKPIYHKTLGYCYYILRPKKI